MTAEKKIKRKPKKNKKNPSLKICKNLFHKHHRYIANSILILLIAVSAIYGFVYLNQNFAANFADDILRPYIGSNATIVIEAAFFTIEDSINKVKYSFMKPNPEMFVKSKMINKNLSKTTLDNFSLERIASPSAFPPLPGEGEWTLIYTGTSEALMAKTFIRPDSQRDYAVAYLVKMDMSRLILSVVAGSVEPGGYSHPGPGKIPVADQKTNKLVAAFNGGFQEKDGQYGMIVGNITYLPLKKNLATLVIYKNANPKILDYDGNNLGKDVIAVRQNGPMLLENSKDVTSSNGWDMQTWGLTTTNSMYTWRSGIGITDNGDLIYAAGPSLIPQTLAAALKAAGAVNAMQLDINPAWDRFVIFDSLENGFYNYYPLTGDMTNGGYQYLFGYGKDFFYLLRK